MDNRYLILENDIITILCNENLKTRPFLMRLCNFDNELYEIRLDKKDIKFIVNFLQQHLEGI